MYWINIKGDSVPIDEITDVVYLQNIIKKLLREKGEVAFDIVDKEFLANIGSDLE